MAAAGGGGLMDVVFGSGSSGDIEVDAALLAAEAARRPSERFVQAHLAALRVAALVLASRRRGRGRLRASDGSRRSIWDVLPEVAPELGEWSAFFGALQLKRQIVQAGAVALVTEREADDLLRDVRTFRGAALGGGLSAGATMGA